MGLRTPLALVILLSAFALSACGEKKPAATAMPEAGKPAEQAATDTAQVPAAEMNSGKAIHDANCISCHDSGVYTRADHKMQDFTQLAAQVRRCDANLGTRLFDEDLVKVTEYLNDTYYKFEKK